MSTLREQYAWIASRTIDATTTTLDFDVDGKPVVLIEVLSSSSLSFKVGLVGKPGTNRTVRASFLSGATTETQVDPDTATGTVAAQDFIMVPTLGAKKVRITRTAGSGTVQGVAVPSDGLTPWLLMKIIDGGIAASISGVSTEAKQDTMITALQLIDNLAVGASTHKKILQGTSGDPTTVKASAGILYAIQACNTAATPIYIKLYDAASNPTAGAGTIVKTIMVPGNAAGAGSNVSISVGIAFATGIAYTVVTGITDASSTGVTADTAALSIDYK